MRYMSTYYWQQKRVLNREQRTKDLQTMGQRTKEQRTMDLQTMGQQGQDTQDRESGCGEESIENRTSLILVQYRYREVPLCFACICGQEGSDGKAGAYLSGQLFGWQQGLPWEKIAARPGRWLAKLEKSLPCVMEHIDRELADSGLVSQEERTGVAGILCAGEYGLVFSRGCQEVYLLNTGFGRGCIRKICGRGARPYGWADVQCGEEAMAPEEEERGEELWLQQGILEQGAGFLVATESFGQAAAGKDAGTCLYVQEMRTAKQAGRHLEELGRCGEALGETDMGAVLLYARKEEQAYPELEDRQGESRFKSGKKHQKAEGKPAWKGKAERWEETGKSRKRSLGRDWGSRQTGFWKGQPEAGQPEAGQSEAGQPEAGQSEAGQSEARQSEEEIRKRAEDRIFLERRGYRVQRLLGQGAFSRVYLAGRTDDGEYVACKVSSRTELAKREAKLLHRLEHPLFAAYGEYWQEGDRSCLVMEYVPGSSLEALLGRRGRLPARRAAQIALELAEGLRYLHTMKDAVLFRDVKPANIMIRQDGRVKLLDLGCACPLEETDRARAGTPGFGAPEQFETPGRADPASDVYGVGQVLRAMLGSRGCMQGGLRDSRRQDAMREEWFGKKYLRRGTTDTRLKERRYRARLRNVAAVCIRQDPEGRLPDMQSLVKALLSCQPGGGWGRGGRGGRGDPRRFIPCRRNLACEKNIWKSTCKNY